MAKATEKRHSIFNVADFRVAGPRPAPRAPATTTQRASRARQLRTLGFFLRNASRQRVAL